MTVCDIMLAMMEMDIKIGICDSKEERSELMKEYLALIECMMWKGVNIDENKNC